MREMGAFKAKKGRGREKRRERELGAFEAKKG